MRCFYNPFCNKRHTFSIACITPDAQQATIEGAAALHPCATLFPNKVINHPKKII